MIWSSSNKAGFSLPHWLSRSMIGLSAAAVTLPFPASAMVAGPFRLGLPVNCDMAKDCSIQKYVDRAQGPERLDYRCGMLTTDAHDGIDIRLRRARDFNRNVRVIAAAPGTVLRVREGMPDISVREATAPSLDGRLAGNAVVIDHGDGWETQYSHLQRGSIRVHPGDKVPEGAVLGAIGMSGNAEFPHLHFEVRHQGRTVDPFAADDLAGCNKPESRLWNASAAGAMPYRETEALAAGFAPTVEAARTDYQKPVESVVTGNPDTLILWGNASGVQSKDMEKFLILDPKGGVILTREAQIENRTLSRVGYAGMRRPASGWMKGTYKGIYSLIRNGKIVGEVTVSHNINN